MKMLSRKNYIYFDMDGMGRIIHILIWTAWEDHIYFGVDGTGRIIYTLVPTVCTVAVLMTVVCIV